LAKNKTRKSLKKQILVIYSLIGLTLLVLLVFFCPWFYHHSSLMVEVNRMAKAPRFDKTFVPDETSLGYFEPIVDRNKDDKKIIGKWNGPISREAIEDIGIFLISTNNFYNTDTKSSPTHKILHARTENHLSSSRYVVYEGVLTRGFDWDVSDSWSARKVTYSLDKKTGYITKANAELLKVSIYVVGFLFVPIAIILYFFRNKISKSFLIILEITIVILFLITTFQPQRGFIKIAEDPHDLFFQIELLPKKIVPDYIRDKIMIIYSRKTNKPSNSLMDVLYK